MISYALYKEVANKPEFEKQASQVLCKVPCAGWDRIFALYSQLREKQKQDITKKTTKWKKWMDGWKMNSWKI